MYQVVLHFYDKKIAQLSQQYHQKNVDFTRFKKFKYLFEILSNRQSFEDDIKKLDVDFCFLIYYLSLINGKVMAIYSTKGLDHLGLVSGMCKEIGVAKIIDQAHPEQSEDKHISYGQLVEAMILNGLGFVGRTLHMYPEYFKERPVERLIGKGIKAEHINDDALGRCLDQLYETGVSGIYQTLSARVVEHLKLPCEGINIDSTSIHVDGEYQQSEDTKAIRITRGYSRDHRPELNQMILNLITENQAGIPIYMQAASGNINDNEGFKNIVKHHLSSLKAAQNSQYFIGDEALYVAETIQSLDEQGQLFISRAPQKLSLVKKRLQSKTP